MQGPVVRSSVVGALVWLTLCIAGAFVVLQRLGEYGSVLHLLIGVAMGILGALAHLILSSLQGFRRLGFMRRGLLNWFCAYLALVALGAILSYPKVLPVDRAGWEELARLLFLYTGVPMLVLAVLVALITSATRRRGEA